MCHATGRECPGLTCPCIQRTAQCPYCMSDNGAARDTYYDQTCPGCVKRMGEPLPSQRTTDDE